MIIEEKLQQLLNANVPENFDKTLGKCKLFPTIEDYLSNTKSSGPIELEWSNIDNARNFKLCPKDHKEFWNKNKFTYKLNSFRFRCEEFPDSIDPESICFLGCSFTFGTGMPKHLCWTNIVSTTLNIKEYNLSFPGASIESQYRLYKYWQNIIKSKYTILLCPPINRREIASEFTFEQVGPWDLHNLDSSKETKLLLGHLLSDNESYMRTLRTIDAIKNVAAETGSHFISLSNEGKASPLARDNRHPGINWNQEMSKKAINYMRKINNDIT